MTTLSASNPSTRWMLRPWLWAALVCALAAIPMLRVITRPHREPLRVLWQLPDWQLVDQTDHPFGARDLRGHIYIANFIFTNCTLQCPLLTRQMAHLQPEIQRLNGHVHLVSISVDPIDDTPERLRSYMTRYHADPTLWTFVTGPADAVMRAVSDGFRVGVEEPVRGPNGEFNPIELAHSNRFALVDEQGRLRGAYEADEDGSRQLLVDLEFLLGGH